jgi:hypothetical protein
MTLVVNVEDDLISTLKMRRRKKSTTEEDLWENQGRAQDASITELNIITTLKPNKKKKI